MKPSPLGAVLADDLLLDRVGARLDSDDDLGALLLAVAHQADTPIPRPVPARRRRSHRGLTVLAALGVAVSGATVAAAVELAPLSSDAASGAPHTRTFLPPSLQALVMPFLAGTPFQGRLLLPFGSLPTVPYVGTATATGLPGLPAQALALPASSATPAVDSELGNQEQQDLSRQKTQAKGTQTTGQGETTNQGNQSGANTSDSGNQDSGGDQPQSAPTSKPPKSTPTSTPTPTPTSTSGNGGTNGQANGAGNGNGATNGQGNGHGRTTTTSGGTTGSTTGGTTGGTTADGTSNGTGSTDDTGDDPVSGGPDKHGKTMRTTTSVPPSSGTTSAKTKTAGGTAPTTSGSTSTEAPTSTHTSTAGDGTATP